MYCLNSALYIIGQNDYAAKYLKETPEDIFLVIACEFFDPIKIDIPFCII